jgi:glutamine synthetase
MYTEGHTLKNVRKLPTSLLDAIRLTDKNKVLRETLGDAFIDSYVKLKMEEWNSFSRHLTAWETANTLDC